MTLQYLPLTLHPVQDILLWLCMYLNEVRLEAERVPEREKFEEDRVRPCAGDQAKDGYHKTVTKHVVQALQDKACRPTQLQEKNTTMT